MALAALLAAGAPIQPILEALHRAGLHDVRIATRPVRRGGIEALLLNIEGAPEAGLQADELRGLIEAARLPERARSRALAALDALVAGEGEAHGSAQAHFHEVGGVDTVVDFVGTALALDLLGIEAAMCPVVTVGAGAVVGTSHGPIPASPPPAAAAILQRARFPLRFVDAPNELVTPTGAAILAAMVEPRSATLTVDEVGIGSGAHESPQRPNIVRVFIGEETTEPATRLLALLEANIDDMTPAALAAARDALLEAGAFDAWLEPILMKKSRAAYKLAVLVPENEAARFADRILRETTTLGVRVAAYRRYEAERWSETVTTTLGTVRVKVSRWGERLRCVPEHDDVAAIARTLGKPYRDVYEIIAREVDRSL